MCSTHILYITRLCAFVVSPMTVNCSFTSSCFASGSILAAVGASMEEEIVFDRTAERWHTNQPPCSAAQMYPDNVWQGAYMGVGVCEPRRWEWRKWWWNSLHKANKCVVILGSMHVVLRALPRATLWLSASTSEPHFEGQNTCVHFKGHGRFSYHHYKKWIFRPIQDINLLNQSMSIIALFRTYFSCPDVV